MQNEQPDKINAQFERKSENIKTVKYIRQSDKKLLFQIIEDKENEACDSLIASEVNSDEELEEIKQEPKQDYNYLKTPAKRRFQRFFSLESVPDESIPNTLENHQGKQLRINPLLSNKQKESELCLFEMDYEASLEFIESKHFSSVNLILATQNVSWLSDEEISMLK